VWWPWCRRKTVLSGWSVNGKASVYSYIPGMRRSSHCRCCWPEVAAVGWRTMNRLPDQQGRENRAWSTLKMYWSYYWHGLEWSVSSEEIRDVKMGWPCDDVTGNHAYRHSVWVNTALAYQRQTTHRPVLLPCLSRWKWSAMVVHG